jgi:hypothetical protein
MRKTGITTLLEATGGEGAYYPAPGDTPDQEEV